MRETKRQRSLKNMTNPNPVQVNWNKAGRPKGTRNVVTRMAKDIISETCNRLGGADRLVAWAKEDPKHEYAFWTIIYPKLLPLTAHVTGNVTVNWPIAKRLLDARTV